MINLSLSGPDDRLLRELINLALGHGQAVVGAFDPKLPGGGFPASRGRFIRAPKLADVPFPVTMEPNLVVEYYSR